MKEIDPPPIPTEQDDTTAAELAWLKENLSIFWPAAHAGYNETGRGAIVVDAYSESLGEETQFHYASLAAFEEQEDDVSGRMVEYVSGYDPEQELVAVIIRQPEEEFEYRMYQIGVGEELVEAVNAYAEPDYRPRPSATEPEAEPELEPPDLETLMEWQEEGGCEAACPYGCWVESDGTCPHGHPSWLIVLKLI